MRLPSFLKDYIPPDAVKQFSELVNQPALIGGLKEAAQRLGWKESWQPKDLQDAMRQARRWVDSFLRKRSDSALPIQSCINATGQIFGSRWVSVPLDKSAVQIQAIVSGGFAERENLRDQLERRIAELCRAESAIVLTSLPQTLLAVSRLLPMTQDWVIAKADCIRLDEGANLSELLALGGRRVTEIGAANVCTPRDVEQALRSDGQALLLVTPSSLPGGDLPWTSFAEQAQRTAKQARAMLVELHLFGHWLDCTALGLEIKGGIPVIGERIQAGADLVIFPSNGLLGGPAGWIVAGKSKPVRELHGIAAGYGSLASEATVATLSEAIENTADWTRWAQTPVGAMLSNSQANLQFRATKLAAQLESSPFVEKVHVETRTLPVGDGIWAAVALPTPVLRIVPRELSAQDLQRKLHEDAHSLVAETEENAVHLALRTIDPDEDRDVVAAFYPEASKDAFSSPAAVEAPVGMDG